MAKLQPAMGMVREMRALNGMERLYVNGFIKRPGRPELGQPGGA